MARKSFAELLAGLAAVFPDNSTGLITPAILRGYFTDFLNAIIPAYAILERRVGVAQNITPANTDIPLVFTSADLLKANGEMTANAGAGEIGRVDKGTTRFTFTADLLEASNATRTLTFTLYRDGAPTVWSQSVTLTSNAQTESITFTMITTAPAAASYTMQVKSSAIELVTFSNMVLVAEVVPVQAY
jgi:hypothetical protein